MKIHIEGFDKFDNDLKKATKQLPKITRKAMDRSTQFIKNRVQNKIVEEGIPYQGGLQQSIYARVEGPYKGVVKVGKKYGIFVEKGTRPHWPPLEPIEKWARIKLGQPGLGFVIARKISKKGTKPHPYFVPAVESSTRHIRMIFDKTLKEFVDVMAGKK